MTRSVFIITLVALAVSCGTPLPNQKDMEREPLTYFSFAHQNSMRMYNGERYDVSTTDDGRVHVVIDEGFPEEKEFYLTDLTIFEELTTIVKTYKTDKYKENYKPRFRIFDGDSWSLSYKYDSKRSVYSGGYMAWPRNYHEMRQALRDYFQKWREYDKGVLEMDYFKLTCKNDKGEDKVFTLERGEEEATMTLHDAERGVDSTLTVSNAVMQELQERANMVRLKDKLYDYVTDEEGVTRCTYFVRYNTGDTISGITCHREYPSHKVVGMLEFFNKWLKTKEE